MDHSGTQPADSAGRLAPESLAVYEWALRNGVLRDSDLTAGNIEPGLTDEKAAQARDNLLELGLLLSDGRADGLIPVDPAIAEIAVRAPLEQEIRRRQSELVDIHTRLRPLAPLFTQYERTGRHADGVRFFGEAHEVRRELSLMTRLCAEEMVSIQPGGGRSPDTLRGIIDESLAMSARGVRLRTLYQHSARASLSTQRYVRAVSAAGAEIRTTAEAFDRIIIFDRETAFVPQQRVADQPQGASVVTDPTVVGFLYRMFENLWESGRPFDAAQPGTPQPPEALRLTILRLMMSGLKDEAIAKRLGMATRTLRRHVKEVTDELGAESRFQAGYRAHQLGLRLGTEEDEEPVLAP
ncbi:LuxR C-terminal-related transcriptional regulator [Streptomyces sp. NPDC004286]|uniref:LuxR C-terminal-related transcriptional regulator n=1 Tax=Streptomyces sp. NPDC004286 TaxID=3364696 RepID=UPI0036B538B7